MMLVSFPQSALVSEIANNAFLAAPLKVARAVSHKPAC
jgi:hypothetical protein